MAAYPFRTPRPGRSWPVRLVVTAMALLMLAAGVLFSAGSDHHRRHAPHAGARHQVTAADLASIPHPHPHTARPDHDHRSVEMPAHGHQHGNEWTPNLTPRVRLDVHTPSAVTAAARPGPLGPGRRAAGSGVTARHASLSLLGVLRV